MYLMNTRFATLILGATLLLPACQSETGNPEQIDTQPSVETTETAVSEQVSFSVQVEGLRLRSEAGPEAQVIRTLTKGELLIDAQEVSDFTTPIRLRGIDFDEPWIKVHTTDDETGWVYGGALNPAMQAGPKAATLLLDKRLATFFGESLAQRIKTYRIQFADAKTSDELAAVYQDGADISEQINPVLEQRITVEDYDQLPDLFWLEQAFPAYQPSLVAEGTIYYLFADYRDWLEKARGTKGKEDDAFVAIALDLFPQDSIAHFYPAYFLQTWDYGGHSLLGRGIHLDLLTKVEKAWKGGQSSFLPALRSMTQGIVQDITDVNNSYWEDQAAIADEMQSILDRKWGILTTEDRIALKARAKQFNEPEKHQISLDNGSGLGG